MSENTSRELRVHPDFSQPQDTELRSKDNVRFYIAATDLMRASGVYRAQLHQTSSAVNGTLVIGSDEDSNVLDFLLKVATGRSPTLDQLVTANEIEEIHSAAMRLEMGLAMTVASNILRAKVVEMTNDPVTQYAMAIRYEWTGLRAAFLSKAVTVAIEYAMLPSMPTRAINNFLAHREARIAEFVKVMTWADGSNLPFHHENNNRCTTCIKSNHTRLLSHKNRAMWKTFQVDAMVRFRTLPSLELLTQGQWVAKILANMAEARDECGHNPWTGIEKKIPHLLDGLTPPDS